MKTSFISLKFTANQKFRTKIKETSLKQRLNATLAKQKTLHVLTRLAL